MSRVGILGGTFDPPHVAHGAMAAAARDRVGLSSVCLMPALSPPHKRADEVSAYAHRLAMAQIAAAETAGVEVSRFEEGRGGPSYTVDLLHAYAGATGDELYFIMGSDSLAELATWSRPEALLAACTVVVFPRVGVPPRLEVPGPARVVVIEEPAIDVSSSQIRARLRAGEPVDAMVAPGVLAYIRAHALYTNP